MDSIGELQYRYLHEQAFIAGTPIACRRRAGH